ncbi:MAG: flavodoxin domain-containing protein, partial [Pseudomonadota bacterium]
QRRRPAGRWRLAYRDVAALSGEHECEIASMEDLSPSEMGPDAHYIFVTSTTGTGDLPTTAIPFVDDLRAGKPDLSHITFSIFGLGDMGFADTFNFGSKQLMEALLELKARMVGERGIFDASSAEMPEDIALPWLKSVLDTQNGEMNGG